MPTPIPQPSIKRSCSHTDTSSSPCSRYKHTRVRHPRHVTADTRVQDNTPVCVCVSAGVCVLLRSGTVFALQPTLQSHGTGTLQRPPESDTATAADRYKHAHFLSEWALPAGFVIGALGDGAVSLYEIRSHSHSEPVSFPSPHSSTLTSDL